jgi:hypothetical protein
VFFGGFDEAVFAADEVVVTAEVGAVHVVLARLVALTTVTNDLVLARIFEAHYGALVENIE